MVFCERCGVALVAVPLSTRQLGDDESVQSNPSELGPEGVLILQVNNDPAPIMVQLRQEVILGRTSEQSDEATFLNLSPYGADDQGVSRRHARLLRDESAVYVMDLHSTNGTQVNGELLPTGVEKRLRDGDELTLGRLQVYVYFEE